MTERTSIVPAPTIPFVIAVGCTGALLTLCRGAAARLGLAFEAVELAHLTTTAARRPRVLIIAADLYGFDPQEFDALARSVGAQRVLVEEGERGDRLEARLCDIMRQSIKPRPMPMPMKQHRSGIRWIAVKEGDAAEDIDPDDVANF